jgi:hypothetical protein
MGGLFLAAVGLAAALTGPPPLRDEEPLPWPRAPELARSPVELLPAFRVSLPLCSSASVRDPCAALGPALGGELATLYRPTPYFAFGASASYSVAHGSVSGTPLSAKTLALGVSARVYLLESGELDPYLEALIGWGSLTTTLAPPGRPAQDDSAFGPLGRTGGGIDWMVSPRLKLGATAGLNVLLLEQRPLSTSLTAGLELGVLLGDSL